MYVSPTGQVVDTSGIQHHQYADDLMLYCALTASQLDDLSPLVHCSDAVSLWFHQNALLLNPGKTEAVLFATIARISIRLSQEHDMVGLLDLQTAASRRGFQSYHQGCRCTYSVFGGGQAAWRHAGHLVII